VINNSSYYLVPSSSSTLEQHQQRQATTAAGGAEQNSKAAVTGGDDWLSVGRVLASHVSAEEPADSADSADTVTLCHSESQLTLADLDHQLDLLSRSELRHLRATASFTLCRLRYDTIENLHSKTDRQPVSLI